MFEFGEVKAIFIPKIGFIWEIDKLTILKK